MTDGSDTTVKTLPASCQAKEAFFEDKRNEWLAPTESPETAATVNAFGLLKSFHLTDAGNAEALALLHGDQRVRYDRTRGQMAAVERPVLGI